MLCIQHPLLQLQALLVKRIYLTTPMNLEGLAILFCREASVIHFGVLVPSSIAPFCLLIFLDKINEKLEKHLETCACPGAVCYASIYILQLLTLVVT